MKFVRTLLLASIVAAAALVGLSPALAQGCGAQNPNCIVPTAPAGTNNNQAASTAFVQKAVGLNALSCGADPTGVKDSLPAWNKCKALLGPTGGALYWPYGNYYFSATPSYTFTTQPAAVKVYGDGQFATNFSFPTSYGFYFNWYGVQNSVGLEDFTAKTGLQGGGVGITFSNTNTGAGFYYGANTQSVINRVTLIGSDNLGLGGADYWAYGFYSYGVNNVVWNDCTVWGGVGTGAGIVINGHPSPEHIINSFGINGCVLNNLYDGVVGVSQIQGLQVNSSYMIVVDDGVQLQAPGTGFADLSVKNTDIDAGRWDINVLAQSEATIITGNFLSSSYRYFAGGGINLYNPQNGYVGDNYIFNPGAAVYQSGGTGIAVTTPGSIVLGQVTIGTNTGLYNFATDISLDSTTAGITVAPQNFRDTAVSVATVSSSSTTITTAASTWTVGQMVVFTGTLGSTLTAGQAYYVVVTNGTTTMQVSATVGGAAITPSISLTSAFVWNTLNYLNAGTGNHLPTGTGSYVLNLAPTVVGGSFTALTGLAIRDTSAAFDVTIGATSSTTLTAGRALTIDVGNVAHTLSLGTTANTITFPNVASDTVAMIAATQTLTNKTLTAPTLTGTIGLGNCTLTGSTASLSCNSTTSYNPQFTMIQSTNDATGASFTMEKNRASAVVQAGDFLGSVVFNGLDSSLGFASGGGIYAVVTAAGSSTVTADLQFYAGANYALQLVGATGAVAIPTATAASSTTTGALQVAGGIGVAKTSYFGGTFYLTGLTVGSGASALCINSTQVETDTSSTICGISALRFKKLLGAITPRQADEGLAGLRTDFWRFKPEYQDHGKVVHVGLIADDVAAMDPRCGIYSSTTGKLMNYEDRCVLEYIVADLKTLRAANDNLRAEITLLKRRVSR